MKVLWITSSPIGPVSRILGLPYGGSSGTWIQTEFEAIQQDKNIQLLFMCPISNIPNGDIIRKETNEGIAYGVGYKAFIPYGTELSKKVIQSVLNVVGEVKPDIIHIWGSESSFSAGCASLLTEYKRVIFIQGLIGMHQRYTSPVYVRENQYWGHISLYQKLRAKIKRYYFKNHIKLEQQAISSAGNVITDNDYTRAYCNSFAPHTNFYQHFLAPAEVFYETEWNIDECVPNRLFTIFGIDKTKGLNQLLKALCIVKKTIADVKLYIPGPFNINKSGLIDTKNSSPFETWLANFIEQNELEDNVVFLGRLDRDGMAAQFKSANCFVSPSGMEVHSSSVREAMAVGVPTISSLCGSVAEYIEHGINGIIYRFEEEEVLAHYIIKILKDKEFAKTIGREARLKMKALKDDKSMNMPFSLVYNSL